MTGNVENVHSNTKKLMQRSRNNDISRRKYVMIVVTRLNVAIVNDVTDQMLSSLNKNTYMQTDCSNYSCSLSHHLYFCFIFMPSILHSYHFLTL